MSVAEVRLQESESLEKALRRFKRKVCGQAAQKGQQGKLNIA